MNTRTRTRTVVFTDMADYTRSVSASDREGLRNLLSMHEKLVGPVLTNLGGRIVKNIGDSFMALFDSATDAIRACMDLVEAHNAGTGAGVSFRAGICTGDVEETDNDAFGEPVNLAARIIARTPTGEVWFSNSTRHCMTQAEIPYETTGRHALKGIAGDIEIFRAVPKHAAYLPDALAASVRTRSVVRWNAGDAAPPVPAGGHVLLEGFRAGSKDLAEALDRLPWLEPGRIHLVTYAISPEDRYEWTRAGRGLVIATTTALTTAIRQLEHVPTRQAGSDTIILDGGGDAVFDLVMAGLALPTVPLSQVVAGYSYDQLPDGRWANRSERAVVRVEVSGAGAELTVLAPGVQVDGQAAPTNTVVRLYDGLVIRTPAGALQFHALDREGYIGALVGDTQMRIPVTLAQKFELGREPTHPGLLLPARGNQDNIRWVSGPLAVRARERGFTLDTSLTGRRQAAVTFEGGRPVVTPLHETCPTILLDAQGGVQRLSARSVVSVGDVLLLGTTCVALREPV